MQDLPHIVHGDFDEHNFFNVEVMPLLERAQNRCRERGIPLMWIAQTAARGDEMRILSGGTSADRNRGMRSNFSSTVFAAMMLFGEPELPACVQMIQNAARAKLQVLNEIRKQFAKSVGLKAVRH